MTSEQIQQYLNALVARALGKGLADPTFTIAFRANSSISGYYRFGLSEAGGSENAWVYGDDEQDILGKMQLAILETPAKEERERNEYLKRLASAIEYGKKVSIDDDLLNPLIAQMKSLSANIIEHRPTAPAVTGGFPYPMNDDIPF